MYSEKKVSESNSRWKPRPYPDHNVDQISKTKINSISFSNVDVKQYIFFIKQKKPRAKPYAHNRLPRTSFRHSSGNIRKHRFSF